MGKPTSSDNETSGGSIGASAAAATPAPVPVPAAAAAAEPAIVRATRENPMPEPPHGGSWERQKNGDLVLKANTVMPTADERSKARRARQEQAEAERQLAARNLTKE
jgi:hypothetical protein